MSTDPSPVELLSRAQCMQLLHETMVGRVVFTAGALPVIRPVRYLVRDDAVLIQVEKGSVLTKAGARQVVAFEIDDINPITGSGWSVVVTGHAVQPQESMDSTVTGHFGGGPGELISISCELVRGRRMNNPAPVNGLDAPITPGSEPDPV